MSASRTNLNETLKEGGRDRSGGSRSRRLRNVFVVVEVALALVLLIGSGLMIRSFWRLQSVDPGFNSSNLLTARLREASDVRALVPDAVVEGWRR